MKKYYISFIVTQNNNNYIINNSDNNYGDIFINVNKNLDENIIKNIKEEIKKSRKLDNNSKITFLNITDLTEREFDKDPFRGSETLSKKVSDEEMEKMEKVIRETVVETSNGQTMDATEVFFDK